ncbi:hypothetical protein MKW92_009815, partial [Papaver armeniacum]
MNSRPQRYYPTNYDKTTLCKTIVSVETRAGSSIFGGDHSGLHYASTSSDSDAEDNGGLCLKESKRERANERTAHSLQSTKKSNERRTMHRQQKNLNPNVSVSSYRTLKKQNNENAMKQQQQKWYCEKENKRPSNCKVLTSHMTSKTSNKEGTKKKKLPCQEPYSATSSQSTSVTNCSSDSDVDSEDNRELCFRESKNEIVNKSPARYRSLLPLLPSGVRYASTSSDLDAEDNGWLCWKKSKREKANEHTAHSLHSIHRQQENHRTLNKENNAMKQQHQKRYCEKENKRPSNRNGLSKVANVLTSHMTSKTSNIEGTKKKKLPCQEPNPGTFFQSTSVTNCSSDPDVDSEDNRELCFRESKNEEVKKGPARFSSLLSVPPTSKSKNKDIQKHSPNISNIFCGPSSIDVFLSCMTSKMSIKEETGKHHWEASWYQGIGKPDLMYGPYEMKYWVTVDGYFRKEIIGGYGAIIRDERGKPIVAFSGISVVPVSDLHHKLQGMVEGLKLAYKYKLLHIELSCNSERVVNIVTRILDTINGCGIH